MNIPNKQNYICVLIYYYEIDSSQSDHLALNWPFGCHDNRLGTFSKSSSYEFEVCYRTCRMITVQNLRS